MRLTVQLTRENLRWLAECPELPGVLVYGTSAEEATSRAFVLALRVLADRVAAGEIDPAGVSVCLPARSVG